ncbi:NADH-quinone oxidoreductase subunit J [Geothrix sp. PMB-07]|uniref:NADH-quinone oxidoreductase subunit J n=1 Tax=Geothrix sp. PMB-07 TaxID=3068640 RepID=UPI0027412339|nr:NADH-quinone oxidoreductase subunit J [Geothrix sp. PMB-07]WLT32239.1 NADH-quinone oxidoreductase subunit J [Geothrix sp. PMB-07]
MFITFALITLLGALGMLLQKNIIVAGLFMVATFFGVAGLFVLLANPVAAAFQLIVYSGAIMVLVLFVIMMLNSHEEEKAQSSRPIQRWVSLALVAALAFGSVKLVLASAGVKALNASGAALPQAMTLQKVGLELFAGHLLGFEVAGLLLLAAMIGAVALTKRNL